MKEKQKNGLPCWEEIPEGERMKYEIAKELGLLDTVREKGWKGLSSKDTGRIGGMLAGRRKQKKENSAGPEEEK